MSEREMDYIMEEREHEFKKAVDDASAILEAIVQAIRRDSPVEISATLGSYGDLGLVPRRDDLNEPLAIRVRVGDLDTYFPVGIRHRKCKLSQKLMIQGVIAIANGLESWEKKSLYGDADVPF